MTKGTSSDTHDMTVSVKCDDELLAIVSELCASSNEG